MPMKLTIKPNSGPTNATPEYIYMVKENIGYFKANSNGGTVLTCNVGIVVVEETCETVAQMMA